MNKRIIILVLWIVSLLALVYAIYRSTNERITMMENGRQVVYGEPQHGLILGLCMFAGICVFSAVLLLLERPKLTEPEPPLIKKRTL